MSLKLIPKHLKDNFVKMKKDHFTDKKKINLQIWKAPVF